MTKFILILSLVCTVAAMTGCKNSNQAKVNGANGGGSDNEAPLGKDEKLGLAPEFSADQFQKDQWIEWRGENAGNSKETQCLTWKWTGIYDDGIKIEGRYSKKCDNAPTYRVEHILFDGVSGIITKHYFKMADGSADEPGTRIGENIFAQIYGNPKQLKAIYLSGVFTTHDKKELPAFEFRDRKGNPYLNRPGNPFNAVALRWAQRQGNVTWIYQYNRSMPMITPTLY